MVLLPDISNSDQFLVSAWQEQKAASQRKTGKGKDRGFLAHEGKAMFLHTF